MYPRVGEAVGWIERNGGWSEEYLIRARCSSILRRERAPGGCHRGRQRAARGWGTPPGDLHSNNIGSRRVCVCVCVEKRERERIPPHASRTRASRMACKTLRTHLWSLRQSSRKDTDRFTPLRDKRISVSCRWIPGYKEFQWKYNSVTNFGGKFI